MPTAAMILGASRDRTNLFISYRQSYTHHPAKRPRIDNGGLRDAPDGDSERAGLMSHLESSGDAIIEMDLLPPRWLDVQDEITQHLSSIASSMKKLDGLHAKHILPGFDDERVKEHEAHEIDLLTSDITRAFNACQRAIKRIDALLHSAPAPSPSPTDETLAHNLQISLATRVGETSALFRKKQAAYLKKLRSLGGSGGGTSTPDPPRSSTPLPQNPYTNPAMQESESDRSSAQSTLQQTARVRQRQRGTDAAIEQREREIEHIAQGVIDLSNLFQDLGALVIDQGSLLDRIDYNVERTAEHTRAAERELGVATTYQKKGTRRLVILLLLLLVLGVGVLLVLKPKRSGAAAAAAPGPGLVEGKMGRAWRRRVEWKQKRWRGRGSSFMVP